MRVLALLAVLAGLWLGAAVVVLLAPAFAVAVGARRVWTGLDQLVNAAAGGNPDETISSRAGKLCEAGDAPRWAVLVERLTQLAEDRHVFKAIERDEDSNG